MEKPNQFVDKGEWLLYESMLDWVVPILDDNYCRIPPQYRPRFHDVVDRLIRACANLPLDDVDNILLQVDDLLDNWV